MVYGFLTNMVKIRSEPEKMTWLVKALADPSDLSLVPEINNIEFYTCMSHTPIHPHPPTHTNVFLKIKGIYN